MGLENIYRHLSGFDLEPEPVESFVSFVERLTDEGRAYAIMQKTTGDAVNEEAIWQEARARRPIIGYGGRETFPFISDPDQKIRGTFAIIDRSLVYSPRGIPLHEMRDSYTWGYSNPKYYVQGEFMDAVQAFLDNGYPLFRSNDIVDYRWEYEFTITGSTTLEEIVLPK